MKKFVVAAALLAFPAGWAVANNGKPKPEKDARKMAAGCVLQAVGAGAYDTMTSEALADFCIDAAIRVHEADYSPEEDALGG